MLDQSQSQPAPPPPALKKPVLKRRRGGQPGNQNARQGGTYSRHQPGPLSHIPLKIAELNQALRLELLSVDTVRERVHQARSEVEAVQPRSLREMVSNLRLFTQLTSISISAFMAEAQLAIKHRPLEKIARDPFDYFARGYKRAGISRDADSFFIVSEKSAQISPLPSFHPPLATNLTDESWAVLAPLVPPDPFLEFVYGQPPLIIAANRYAFTPYTPGGEFADFVIMEEYRRLLQRTPALLAPPPAKRRARSRKYSPRALLDAILWKLATGHTWKELPDGFPPVRACQKYYRRLFRSGRFYTMLLALYNHMRLEMCVDPWNLLEAGLFTTTPGARIALIPEAAPTNENYTALLFMQLARGAYMAFERDRKERQPLYTVLPVFKGDASLSTARLPGVEPQLDGLDFIPLEKSSAWKRMQASKREQKAMSREAARPARSPAKDKESARTPAKSPASREGEKLLIEKLMGSFQDVPAHPPWLLENENGADSSAEHLLRVLEDFLERSGL